MSRKRERPAARRGRSRAPPTCTARRRARRLRPHGVRRGERRVELVAARVDQNAPAAIGLVELLREMLGIALHERASHGVREARLPDRSRRVPSSGTTT